MGVYDELCSSIWPDPKTRPFFVIGTTTHGATPDKTGGMVHHRSKPGEGDFKWGVVSDPRKEVDLETWLWGKTVSNTPILAPPSSPSLPLRPTPPCTTDLEPLSETITALLSISQLSPSLLPVPHLHHQLLLKLALNSVINPLTAIIGAGSLPNGALANSSPSYRLIRDLCRETSSVLTAYLHSLSAPHTPPFDVIRLFSWEGLERRILALIHATAENMSSMAVDVSKGRTTEIEHINGYIVALGKRLSVETPCHRIVREMVKFTAEVNGLKPAFAETSDLVADRRAGIQGKLGRGRQLSSRQMDIEEKRLELEERRLYLAEEQMLENKRARRRIARSAKEIHSARNDMAVRRDLMESALNRGIVPDSKEDVADVTAAENPEHSIDTPSANHEVQAAPKATAGPAQTRTAATNEPRATPPQIVTDAGDTAPPRSSPPNGSYYYSRDDAPRNQQSLSASAK